MKQSTEGPPMYVESLLTEQELQRLKNIYTTYSDRPTTLHTNPFKWRYGMGRGLPIEEIKIISKRLDDVLKQRKSTILQ